MKRILRPTNRSLTVAALQRLLSHDRKGVVYANFRNLLLGAILAVPAVAQSVQITTPSPLSTGYVGIPYSLTFQATTNPPNQPLTWSVPSGTLPPGLVLNSNGTLSGTPTTAGSYSFTIQASLATVSPPFGTATITFTMTVTTPSLSITSTSPLANAFIGQPYSVTLTANANPNNVVWSGGQNMPPGLTLNSNGLISGSPSALGSYTFNVTASIPNTGVSASQNFMISVFAGQLTILTASLPVAYVGQPYSATLTATVPNVTWTLVASTLPSGITLNAATGTFSGATSAAGSYFIQVIASLTNYPSVTLDYTLYVASQPLQISQTQLPLAVQGSPYSASLTGTGGITPYTWSMTGNPSTDGLTINASTGTISGTPTATGSFTLNVQLSDVTNALPAAQALVLQVAAPLSITTTSLPVGPPSVLYSETLAAAGGLPPYSWALAAGSGALPPGLTLSPAGVIGGTIAVNATGVYSFTVQVTDSGGHTATKALSIAIGAAVVITTPSSLPDGVVGKMYSQTLAAGGGTMPYTWSLTSGSLPAGLSFNANVISGTPTAAGSSTFTVQVTDSTPGQPLTNTKSFTLRIDTPLSISAGNLTATLGVAFSQALAATGGAPPYVWTISSGSLPAGLSLSAGVISGTPSVAGIAIVTLEVADSAGQTAPPKTITITVTQNQISIMTGNLSATVGVAFSQLLAATGGTPPYTWTITSGSLPAGLSLNSGVISGTPTTAGASTITLLVTDSQNLTASASITITVNSPLAPSVTVTVGTGTSLGAAQQQPINISLSNGYPSDITVSLTLTFQSSVGGEDQTVQFLTPSGGTQSLTLTVPAGSLAASAPPMLATGTTAGTITITTTALTAAGATLSVPAPMVMTIPKSSPVITNVTFSNTGGSLTVTVTGYSPTRDMVSGNFTFSPASGSTLTQSEVTVQLGSAFSTWYQNTASYAYGSEFLLTIPFTVSGNAADVISVSVTLTNSFGTSSAASAQ